METKTGPENKQRRTAVVLEGILRWISPLNQRGVGQDLKARSGAGKGWKTKDLRCKYFVIYACMSLFRGK